MKARRALDCLAPLGIDAETLSAVAHNLAMENGLLRQAVREALDGKVDEVLGSLAIDPRAFRRMRAEVQRRFLTAAIGWIAGGDYAPRADAVRAFGIALAEGRTHTLAGVIGWTWKGGLWLAREPQAVKEATGNPFDGRWRIGGPVEEGQEIRALGEDGLNALPDWRDLGFPRRALLALPAVWEGENLVSAPLLEPESPYNATLLRPRFDNWLG
ncbi:MAG: hypothetical protein R3D85_11580 [Paracoccaceae bacterium]